MAGRLSSPRVVAELLHRYGLRPNRRLGQHFLVDANVVERVAEAAGAREGLTVVEIGAGLGALTEVLARYGARVVAVEVDRGLVRALREELGQWQNVEVVEGDILDLDLSPHIESQGAWSIAGNLPYVITSPVLFKFLTEVQGWRQMTVMVQKEVARRLTAAPGSKDYGPLTLGANYRARIEVVRSIPPAVFYPPPEVESALIRLELRTTPAVRAPDDELLFRVVRGAFGQRRKTLRNSLGKTLASQLSARQVEEALEEAAIDPGSRAQELTLEEYGRLTWAVAAKMGTLQQEPPG